MNDNYLQFQLHLGEYDYLDRRLAYIERERESHLNSMQLLYRQLTEKEKEAVEACLEERDLDLVFQG